MINCHFVSRFATKPWEFGPRWLWCFDFERDGIYRASSETLFAVAGENTREVEERLNTLIETPISQEVARWRNGQPAAADLPWPLFRAVALLLLQPTRSATEGDRAVQIEDLVMKPDAELDQLAHAAEERYQMGRISVRQDAALLYPERGWFWMPAQDNRGQWVACPAIPMGLHHVIVSIPRALDYDRMTDIWRQNGSVMVANRSVGHDGRRVVIPPAHRAAYTDAEITQTLKDLRADVVRLTNLMRQSNDLIRRMDLIG